MSTNAKPLRVRDILPITNVDDYKVHFGKANEQGHEPLDAWLIDHDSWEGWQIYKSPKKGRWGKSRYVFSLIHLYQKREPTRDFYLFGGVFEVTDRRGKDYSVRRTDIGERFIGRLELSSTYRAMQVYPNLKTVYDDLEVTAIRAEEYAGRVWSGYDDIHLPFGELRSIIRTNQPDWKTPLESVNGVYLITDSSRRTPMRYVGCTYGADGVWPRWTGYVDTGHNGNIGLREILDAQSSWEDHCTRHWHFTLLEYRKLHTSPEQMQRRESWWKTALRTRRSNNESGLNAN